MKARTGERPFFLTNRISAEGANVKTIIDVLEVEKVRLLDLRLLLCKHSRSGAHNRLVSATDALNHAINDIKKEMKGEEK